MIKIDFSMIYYYKCLLVLLLPFFMCFVYVVYWSIFTVYYSKSFKFFLEKIIVTSAVIFINFMFSVINMAAQFLDCKNLGSDRYINVYLSESCSSEKYLFWRNYIILPAFIFFSIIVPGLILIYLFRKKKKLYEKKEICRIGFMLQGYRKKAFYW